MTDSRFSEDQKRRLRENMINTETGTGGNGLSPFSMGLIIAAAIALMAAAAWFISRDSVQTEYRTVWEFDTDSGGTSESFKGAVPFKNGAVVYTRDGAMFVDSAGKVTWERSYQMKSPVADVSENYAVLADKGSTNAFIFDADGETGAISTVNPLSEVRISDQGVVFAVLNSDEAEYINAYRQDGTAIDLSVKSVFTGDGYPYDIDVSPDGTQLITAYLNLSENRIASHVIFRNFGEVGQNEDARRIVGGFHEEFRDHIAGKVNFSDNEYSQAFHDGGFAFFSTRVLNRPELIENVSVERRISRVACGNKAVSVLLEAQGEDLPQLLIYSTDGKLNGKADISFACTGMNVSDSNIVLWNHDTVFVYSAKGKLRAELHPEGISISQAFGSGGREILLSGGSRLMKIAF